MRSVESSSGPDLTARARIRDAALHRFATDGFGAPIRAIAADAGVSPALVLHHFGSKDGLRRACDEHVRRLIVEAKEPIFRPKVGRPPARADILALLGDTERFGVPTLYLLRAFQAGGELARDMFAQLVELTERALVESVAAGTVRPSLDDAARARYLVVLSLGALVVDQALNPADPHDPGAMARDYLGRYALPSAEVFTDGFLLDRTMLDTVVAAHDGPTAPGHQPDEGTAP